LWTAALSGVGLFLAFRPWLRLHRPDVVVLAAVLFSSVWTVIFYGFTVMPNEWVALATVTASGYLLLFVVSDRHRDVGALCASMVVIALLRPSDALYVGAALVICCALLRGPGSRRVRAVIAVAVGAVVGSADWVIEAYTTYGGLSARIHAAQAEQGGGGLHFSGIAQARALAGPVLCRYGCQGHSADVYRLWWIPVAALVVVGIATAGPGRYARQVVPTVVGLAVGAQYILTVPYAAPRFLIPTYAALSLPAAAGALRLVTSIPSSAGRRAVGAVFLAGLITHLVIQLSVITTFIKPAAESLSLQTQSRAALLHGLGVQAPCIILGEPLDNQNLAYALRCTNPRVAQTSIPAALRHGVHIVWLRDSPPPHSDGAHWHRVRLPHHHAAQSRFAYVSHVG
jgi:hypothetical protein